MLNARLPGSEHGSNEYLYTPGDRQDLINKFKSLIENDDLRQTMGDYPLGKLRNRALASVEEYGWSQVIENLVNIWLEAINQSTVNSQQLTVNNQHLTTKLITKKLSCQVGNVCFRNLRLLPLRYRI